MLAMKFAMAHGFGHCRAAFVNHPDTMPTINRREFLAGSAAASATVAAPAAVRAQGFADVDVAIIGGGAAGIAAARRVIAAKRRCVIVEATGRLGGRCITDNAIFGVPFDRGAHWLHLPDSNPLAQLAPSTGLDLYDAPRGLKLRVPPRAARDIELEDYFTKLVHANRAIVEAGRAKGDLPAAAALPADLGDWRDTIEFSIGPYSTGKELAQLSATDMSRAVERGRDAFCREGFGALLVKLAAGLPVRLGTPVDEIDWDNGVVIATSKGRFRARAAIVTASTGALAAGKLNFKPALPKRQMDAINALSLGSYDHIALDLPGNPLGLDRDDLVIEKSSGPKTAALLANIGGTSLCTVDVAGGFGRDLARQGEPAMAAFARDWLKTMFGNDVGARIGKTAATRWNDEPYALGAFSAAAPNGADARRVLMEPLRERVWFAGEAVHQSLWGTVGGAWESGNRAAEAALKKIGALKERDDDKPAPRRRRR
ncbi:MAG: flavin monoamine oxidase family protein [Xanthobacteraceae bacterium]|uniref:flavin monoamine oxidase family protein n=1 Tax=Pseudolabrys sp. TaxID=1960880 RepID=UPI003D10DFFB